MTNRKLFSGRRATPATKLPSGQQKHTYLQRVTVALQVLQLVLAVLQVSIQLLHLPAPLLKLTLQLLHLLRVRNLP